MIRRIGIGLAALIVILTALYMWSCNPFALGLPTDGELVRVFRANREAFERLRTMALEDAGSVSYLSRDTLQQSPLNQARRAEYARLMAFHPELTLGIGRDQVTFKFAAGGVGLAIARSWMKGITYLRDGREKNCVLMKSLDHLGTVSDGVYLVPIETNWFVVFAQTE